MANSGSQIKEMERRNLSASQELKGTEEENAMSEPARKPDQDDDSVEQKATNAIGPAGQTADKDVAEIVSGQPAGGPHDLGRKAHKEPREG